MEYQTYGKQYHQHWGSSHYKTLDETEISIPEGYSGCRVDSCRLFSGKPVTMRDVMTNCSRDVPRFLHPMLSRRAITNPSAGHNGQICHNGSRGWKTYGGNVGRWRDGMGDNSPSGQRRVLLDFRQTLHNASEGFWILPSWRLFTVDSTGKIVAEPHIHRFRGGLGLHYYYPVKNRRLGVPVSVMDGIPGMPAITSDPQMLLEAWRRLYDYILLSPYYHEGDL